ncbi:transporter substrate-binding domain-containing protein [Kitasatospora sp. NPDC018619]|uniref:transporter substrate-binding domain-containing protein n=1 Tax=unclassified Kitasatospora TaxID=2633591 RepID=UPI003793A9E1
MHTLVNGTGRRLVLCALAATALLAGCDGGGRTAPPQPAATTSATQQAWLGSHVNIGVKNDQPGLNQKDNYHNSGFDYDLAMYLGKKMGFTPNLVDVPSDQREEKLKNGDVQFVIASYSITPERKAQVDFAGPYLKTSQALLVRAGETRFTKPGDVAKKHICTATGSTSAAGMASTALPTPDTLLAGSLYSRADFSTCVDDLRKGDQQADAVYTDAAVLYGFTQLFPGQLKVLPLTFGSINYYGIGIQKGHRDVCRQVVQHLKAFLREEWMQRFHDNLPSIEDALPGRFANEYRPDGNTEVDQYSSCS